MKKQNWTQRATIYFGIFMATLMALSLILPALQPDTLPTLEPEQATETPRPTLPAPLTDFSGIAFDEDYLHPSGFFVISQPTGWTPNPPVNNTVQAQANFNNPNQLSVIEAYIQQPAAPVTTYDELNALFTAATLGPSWARYTGGWEELARRQDAQGRLQIDFELQRGGQTFLARHVAWSDGDWVYVVRVVVPENAADLLFFMVDAVIPTIRPQKQFDDTPMGWNGYYDREFQHILRFPSEWQLTDSRTGRPASIESGQGIAVRVEGRESMSIDDEAAAREFVENLPVSPEVVSIVPVERNEAAGFSVAYQYTDADGASRSGLAVLLNGVDGNLHIANATLADSGVDLNSEDARATYFDLTTALDTFSLLTGINLPPEPVPPTPTPRPTATAEATSEATPEATAESTAEATPEAAPEAAPEATEDGG